MAPAPRRAGPCFPVDLALDLGFSSFCHLSSLYQPWTFHLPALLHAPALPFPMPFPPLLCWAPSASLPSRVAGAEAAHGSSGTQVPLSCSSITSVPPPIPVGLSSVQGPVLCCRGLSAPIHGLSTIRRPVAARTPASLTHWVSQQTSSTLRLRPLPKFSLFCPSLEHPDASQPRQAQAGGSHGAVTRGCWQGRRWDDAHSRR